MRGRADRPNAGRISVKIAYVNITNLNMAKINMAIRHTSACYGQRAQGVADAGLVRGPMSTAHPGTTPTRPGGQGGASGHGPARPDGQGGGSGHGPARPDGQGGGSGRGCTRSDRQGGAFGRGSTRSDGRRRTRERGSAGLDGRRAATTNFTWSCGLRSVGIAARLDLSIPGVARIRFPAGCVKSPAPMRSNR
jgi:hypothetical protein